MSFEELSPRYNSREVEAKWYSLWESKGYFRPKSDREGKKFRDKRYVIVIPPPNVTGILHMGHALNNSIQDILIRSRRMQGFDTLWVPGVDHAGIATQNVVERKLAKEKKTRHDLGREKFLQEVWKWKEEHGSTITRQLRSLGASCDWTRERFTMDEGLSRAVRESFVTLYERGLIYQGHYIINWCPRCQTALSDEESAHKDVQGGLYHIKYPISGTGSVAGQVRQISNKDHSNRSEPVPKQWHLEKMGVDHIVVATTRPETMLGDTAVAVHPEDERYKHLVGKKVILPLIGREIPVIADEFVDREFGTGFVKVTPAHDPNDFEMGRRHNLPQVNIMNLDASINEKGGVYKGLDRFDARKKVIEDLEAQGLFVRRDSHLHSVGHCYRCNTVVEPYLSKQWFVRMKPLAEKALAAHKAGKTKFYPQRWDKVYTNWLEGIRDWCISRQIWWGHQIPAWYCEKCQELSLRATKGSEAISEIASSASPPRNDGKGVVVSRKTPEKCPDCGHPNLRQDPDVLDTWFSSWLWPFSTLGWPATEPPAGKPEQKNDLKYFYPTSDLITAPEIIFFWVARMIMAGLEFMGEVPFSKINIHGTVRAQTGLKMSKSLGNAIDPVEVIEEMGADALRFSMIMLSAQDVYLSREKFEVGRNFTNKLWNAARFALMNLTDFKEGASALDLDFKALPLASRWILSKLVRTAGEASGLLDEFLLSQASGLLYHFVWNDFCDWYIELSKPVLTGPETDEKKKTQKVLFFTLERILRLLHPFVPFITEEIWQNLKARSKDQNRWPESVMLAAWPSEAWQDRDAEKSINLLQQAVAGIRDIRTRLSIPPAEMLRAVVSSPDSKVRAVLSQFEKEVKTLGRLESFETKDRFQKSKAWLGNPFADFEVWVMIEGVVDPQKERDRVRKKISESENYVSALRKKLSNRDFVQNAPVDIVEQEKEKLTDAEKILESNRQLLILLE